MIYQRFISAEREVSFSAAEIFKIIADPSRHHQFYDNDNLARAD